MQRSVELFHLGRDVKRQYDEARGSSYLSYAAEFLPKRGEDGSNKKTKKADMGKEPAQKPVTPEAEDTATQSKDSDERSFLNKASGGWMGASGRKHNEADSTDENVSSFTNVSSYTESFVDVDDENVSDETSS